MKYFLEKRKLTKISNEENQSIDDIEKVDEILQQVTKEKSTESGQIDIAQEKYNKVLSTINEAYQTRSIHAFEAVEIALQEFKLILN